MIGAESICTGSRSSPTPSTLMIHEIDPTVKIWPGCRRDEELAKLTILFDMETACTPLPSVPTIDRISSVVLRGVSHEGRLIGRDACNREQEGNRDTRVRQVQAVSMIIPYCCGLLDCIGYRMILCEFVGGPYPPYIVRGAGYKSVRSRR